MIVVARLLDPRWLVEVELDAILDPASPGPSAPLDPSATAARAEEPL
ncbi:MAG: hypothetical protein WKH47_04210 [Actinomycetes bacterium]